MRPLIPKVRIGSVLYGTKNLRNWLRKASLLNCLELMHAGHKVEMAKKAIFSPQKDDEYIVAVNAWDRFCVWSPRSNIVLTFLNRDRAGNQSRKSSKRLAVALSHLQEHGGAPPDQVMDPSIFPSWFINTDKRNIDLKQWPGYAYHLWASLHMNIVSSHAGDIRLVPSFPRRPFSAPFQYHEVNEWEKHDVQAKLVEGLRRGITRRKHGPPGGMCVLPNPRGMILGDLEVMDQKIQRLVDNPRFRQTTGVTVDVVHGDLVVVVPEI